MVHFTVHADTIQMQVFSVVHSLHRCASKPNVFWLHCIVNMLLQRRGLVVMICPVRKVNFYILCMGSVPSSGWATRASVRRTLLPAWPVALNCKYFNHVAWLLHILWRNFKLYVMSFLKLNVCHFTAKLVIVTPTWFHHMLVLWDYNASEINTAKMYTKKSSLFSKRCCHMQLLRLKPGFLSLFICLLVKKANCQK